MEEKFQSAIQQCRLLCEVLSELRMTIVEDRPLKGVVRLVDHIGDSVDALFGSASEMQEALIEAHRAIEPPVHAEQTRQALATCLAKTKDFATNFFFDLASYETVIEIISLGTSKGGEWKAWADLVQETISRCQQTFFTVNFALCECWHALAERVETLAISVRATPARR